jgi:N-acyl-L-homoserine lactone synthetase
MGKGDDMIKILTGRDNVECRDLFDQMFRGRALIFHDRLRWNVTVREGMEIDRYDEEADPIYIVSVDDTGQLTGSLRLLPTTDDTMLRNEFATFFSEPVDVASPTAWECTRFCVHPVAIGKQNAARKASSDLLIGLCELAIKSGIEQIVGLYDARMTGVYRRIGWSPKQIAMSRPEIGKLIVGVWDASQEALDKMLARSVEKTIPALHQDAA